MSRILILGGTGMTGKLLSSYLMEHSAAAITLAGRNINKAQAYAADLNQKFPGQRVSAAFADASQADSLRTAFQDHNLVLIAAPTTAWAEDVIEAALAVRVDYLDVQLSRLKIDLLRARAGEIEAAGLTFITEAGYHPGLPSAMVRYAALQLDILETAITAGYLNMGKNLPYTEAVSELVDAFKQYNGQIFKDGQWTGEKSFTTREFDFGTDIGKKRCSPMFFDELRDLPGMFPDLHETGFYISELHWMTDYVIMPVVWMCLKVAPNAVGPTGKLLWWGMGTFHKPPYRVDIQVQVTGLKDGQPAKFQASVSHPDGYVLTAVPVVATLLQYLDGTARKPGLWMMGHLVEPERLMTDMQRLGAKVVSSISTFQA